MNTIIIEDTKHKIKAKDYKLQQGFRFEYFSAMTNNHTGQKLDEEGQERANK